MRQKRLSPDEMREILAGQFEDIEQAPQMLDAGFGNVLAGQMPQNYRGSRVQVPSEDMPLRRAPVDVFMPKILNDGKYQMPSGEIEGEGYFDRSMLTPEQMEAQNQMIRQNMPHSVRPGESIEQARRARIEEYYGPMSDQEYMQFIRANMRQQGSPFSPGF